MARSPFIAVLLLLLARAAASAAPPPIKVALFDVAPYAHLVQGQAAGLYVELAQRLLATAGLRAEFQILPFARLPIALERGEADLSIGFATEALDRVAKPMLPVALVDSIVVARAATSLHRVDALKGRTLGRARGGCRDLATRDELAIRWVDVSGFDSALRMLALGRLDAVCLTREVLRHQLRATGLDPASFGPQLLVGQRTVWLFAGPGLDAGLAERLRAALARRAPLRLD